MLYEDGEAVPSEYRYKSNRPNSVPQELAVKATALQGSWRLICENTFLWNL